jgi:hypothetical protein
MSKTFKQLSDQDKKILDLWENGHSATEVGNHFNMTRNAIMGRVYRARQAGMLEAKYKIDPETIKSKPKKTKKTSQKYVTLKKKTKPLPILPTLEPSPESKKEPVGILDLKPSSCRYIVNDNISKPLFCGSPKKIRSYCKQHADLCYVPSNWRKKWPIDSLVVGGIILTAG